MADNDNRRRRDRAFATVVVTSCWPGTRAYAARPFPRARPSNIAMKDTAPKATASRLVVLYRTEIRSGRDSHGLRLCPRRRWLGRLNARSSSFGGPQGHRLPDRGWWRRQGYSCQSTDRRGGDAFGSAENQQLGLRDSAAARAQRPPWLSASRQGARRLERNQRNDLHPRPPHRLRRFGRPWLRKLVVERCSFLFQARRRQ